LPFLCSCSRFNVLISLWHKKRKKRKEVEALEHLAGEFQTNIQPDASIYAGSLNLYPPDKIMTINKHSV
jgi:hypothetical protein